MRSKKLTLLITLILLFLLWLTFDLGSLFTLENAKLQQNNLHHFITDKPIISGLSFFVVYIIITALSLPGAVILTLLGGALFGFGWGLVIVSFASTIGATIAFLFSRFLLRDWVQNRFGDRLDTINAGIEKEGTFYLFTLRLIPIFPFFIVNLVMGLTPFKVRDFYWVSQIGMLAGTAVYVNAGIQLAEIDSLSGILSLPLLASFALLGIFPLIAKRVISMLKTKKVYAEWTKPAQYDTNIVVIGAGSGGLVSAYIAAAVKAKVTLIEKHRMGGDCLNTGCVPSKALIRSAHAFRACQEAKQFGINNANISVDFAAIMSRIQQVITKIEPHDSVDRYRGLGVDCIQGEATILSPWEVEVNNQRIISKNIIIATGAKPLVPPIPGLDTIDYLTSDTVWGLRQQPQRLLVLGGGPIGCELAQSFSLLGSDVTLVEMAEQILIREDPEAAALVAKQMQKDSVQLLTNHKASRFGHDDKGQFVELNHNGNTRIIYFDNVLLALGRSANVDGIGLEKLGIELTDRKTIMVNDYLQTKYPNIYAVGDVCGPYQFTHAAAHQAWYAAVNGLFGALKKFKVDYRVMPAATYTTPELASVGISIQQAKERGIEVDVICFDLDDLDRAITDGEDVGFIKVITPKGKDKILGVTIVGHRAGELLAEFTLAMTHGLGLNKILSTIHPYPTMSEAVKYTAGAWKKANAPQGVLRYLKRYHAWRRS
ncbi:dihydrolipoyl dehydrogenase [Thaumasiovibrio sp. DFM-14]|uniref:dihydrolipoyl dehydrogenase n=1 Tax=Thaumasiovibrio sp. DFM-14 TaxID=3384792 RepID=UPI0039A2BF6A